MQFAHFLGSDTTPFAAAYCAMLRPCPMSTAQHLPATDQPGRAAVLLAREHTDIIDVVTAAHSVALADAPLADKLASLPEIAHLAACRDTVNTAHGTCEIVLHDPVAAVRTAELLHSVPEATTLVLHAPKPHISETASETLGQLAQLVASVARHAARAPRLHSVRLDGSYAAAAIALILHLHLFASMRELSLCANDIETSEADAACDYIAKLTQLTKIDLSDNQLCFAGGSAFWPALARLTGLSELVLSHMWLTADVSIVVFPHLAALTRLTRLAVRDVAVAPNGVLALQPALLSLRRLADVSLVGIALTEGSAETLGAQLAALPALRSLALSAARGRYPIAVARALAPHLARCSRLTRLDLSSNMFGDAGADLLAPHLAELRGLIQLSLAGSGIDAARVAVGRALRALHKLEDLDISGNPCVAHLVTYVTRHPKLTRLIMAHDALPAAADPASDSAAHELAAMPALHRLDLSQHNFHDDASAGAHLARATRLTHISMRGSRGTRLSGDRMLSIMLPKMCNLAHLNVGGTDSLSSVEDAAIIGALAQLTYLDWSCNTTRGMSDMHTFDFIAKLAESLKRLDQLAHLSLRKADLGGDSLAELQPVLSTREALTFLDLGGNAFDDESVLSCVTSLAGLPKLQHFAISASYGVEGCAIGAAQWLASCIWLTHLEMHGSSDASVVAQMRPWLEQLSQLRQLIMHPVHLNPGLQTARAAALGPRLAAVAVL